MKKKLLIGLMLILPTLIFAQNEHIPTIDERLYEVFDTAFLVRLQEKTPSQLEYYNFILDNVYQIVTVPNGKTSTYTEVTINDLKHLNILQVINNQGLKRNYNNQSIYKIANTNKFLILISEKELVKKFNKHTGRKY